MKKIYSLIFLIVVLAAYFIFTNNKLRTQINQPEVSNNLPGISINQPAIIDNQPAEQNLPGIPSVANNDIFQFPLDKTLERITKKPFGIYITPQSSPVQPEKFTGYHTGVDFEIFPGEENVDVEVKAICSGSIIFRNFVSGYGGVAVQACKLSNQDVTVLYGHLKLSSISAIQIQDFPVGQTIGILGKGFSQETDGERKHLHLGVHLGKKIGLLGYVQNKSDLVNWLDVTKSFSK
jgi:hypothetical protein